MKEKLIKLVEDLKNNSTGDWSVTNLNNVDLFTTIALEKAIQHADSIKKVIFETNGYNKSNAELYNEGAEFNYEYEMLLNEFKDYVYDEIATQIKALGGNVIYSSTDIDDFVRECRLYGIENHTINSFGELERFDIVYKISA